MVPLTLLLWQATELAAYAALVHGLLGTSWLAASLAAMAVLLVFRASLSAVTWAYAAAYASPAPALPWRRKAAMAGADYLAYLALFVLLLPFERLWMAPDRLRPCRRPLLLVHGYGCSRGIWWWLRRRLEAAGHTVATVSLAPPYASIGRLEPLLARRIDEVCAATGADRVILVAHSMGGLVCRLHLARHGPDRVARLVTLASPHAGSELARIGPGRNAREMEPGSRWLQDLAGEPLGVPAVAVRNRHDNYAMPQDTQRLAGAEDVTQDGIGHLAMLFSPRTAAIVLQAVGGNDSDNPMPTSRPIAGN